MIGKYIVNTWNDVIGNNHIKEGIKNISINAPIMFEGTTGSGKTTFAHLRSNEFGAPKENIFELDCGQLSAQNVRDIVKEWNKTSFFGKKKVYIFDEIQKLSPEAQQALLNPINPPHTPPEHILVIACTTDPQKILKQLLRRFNRFPVATLNEENSKEFVNTLCRLWEISLNKYVKYLVQETCKGIPGLILTAIPKIIGLDDEDEIKYLLSVNAIEEDEQIMEFFKVLMAKPKWDNIKNTVKKITKEYQPDVLKNSLLNIAGGYMLSDYYKDSIEPSYLIECLSDVYGFPEKPKFVNALFKYCSYFKQFGKG